MKVTYEAFYQVPSQQDGKEYKEYCSLQNFCKKVNDRLLNEIDLLMNNECNRIRLQTLIRYIVAILSKAHLTQVSGAQLFLKKILNLAVEFFVRKKLFLRLSRKKVFPRAIDQKITLLAIGSDTSQKATRFDYEQY